MCSTSPALAYTETSHREADRALLVWQERSGRTECCPLRTPLPRPLRAFQGHTQGDTKGYVCVYVQWKLLVPDPEPVYGNHPLHCCDACYSRPSSVLGGPQMQHEANGMRLPPCLKT